MAHDVFISYSSKDKPIADAAVAALEARGIRCWIAPRDIVGGVDWSEAIIEAINACRVMLLVFSQNANESHQIKREVERAVAKGVPVIPLRIEDVPLAKSLEYFISMPHWIDALTPERQQRLDYLAETVQMLLDRQAGRPADAPTPERPPIATQPSRRGVVIASIVGALAIVAVVAFLRKPEPQPQPEPTPTAPPIVPSAATPTVARAASPVDPRLVGSWSATVTSKGIASKQAMEVKSDGRFTWDVTVDDSGTMQAMNGGILQSSREHGTFPQAYVVHDDGTVTINGPAGSGDWRRTSGGGAGGPTFDSRLVGTWTTDTIDPQGRAWTSTLQMSGSGAYSFRAAHHEAGKLRAGGASWSATADSGAVRQGAMSFQGDDVVVMRDDATGDSATWRRRS